MAKDSVLGKLLKPRKEAPGPAVVPDKTQDIFSELRQAFQKVKELEKQTSPIPALQAEIKKLTSQLKDLTAKYSNVSEAQEKLEAEVGDIDLSGLEAKVTELEKQEPESYFPEFQILREKLAETVKFMYEAKTVLHPPNGDISLGVQDKDLDMGGNKILNVEGSEAASKKYVDEATIRVASSRGGGGLSRKGTTEADDYARFTSGGQLEGRSASEARNDVLPSKTGNTLKTLRVNAGETDVEWAAASGSGDMLAANNLSDVVSAQTSRNNILPSKTGNTLKTLRVNAGETDVEWATAAGSGDMLKATYDSNDDGVILKAQLDPDLANTSGTNTGDNAANTSIAATKIDDLTQGDDNTDLDTSTTRHGLAPKAVAPAAGLINVLGIANGETAITNKALFDATVPSTQAIADAAATGTATVSARRDHKHAMPSQATMDTASVAAVNAAGFTPAENFGFTLDPALSGDGKWTGIVEAGTLGATVAFGEVVYFKTADSQWYLAKADATATSGAVKVGICLVAGNDNGATTILLFGKVYASAYSLTVGSPVFISAATAGVLTSTAPTGTTNFVVRIAGYCVATDELFFQPDNTYLELA